ncbi:hypothetical protein COLO4_27593 [Corchorus olitorius]|uniref:Uncharacterized protein n=1 Tax=Corchorus olitorius TaxID=93759 RepID=A0A1R3HQ55_9ROSI|nr:hypothetical protein COLO4_27593 [Corchorus olitorius]
MAACLIQSLHLYSGDVNAVNHGVNDRVLIRRHGRGVGS